MQARESSAYAAFSLVSIINQIFLAGTSKSLTPCNWAGALQQNPVLTRLMDTGSERDYRTMKTEDCLGVVQFRA